MRTRMVAILALLGLLLGACATFVTFDIVGSYDVTGTVTESTSPSFSPGDVDTGIFDVAESGETVSVTVGGFFVLTGTRSGNTVNVSYSAGDTTAVYTLVWTSDTTFEGTGRTDDMSAGTYWVYDFSGTATTTTTSISSAFMD